MVGIKNTSDEAAYSAHPLYAESGAEVPKIWEGVAGSPVTPVDEFNLRTLPLLDEQIAARASAFISRIAPRPDGRSSPTCASHRCTLR